MAVALLVTIVVAANQDGDGDYYYSPSPTTSFQAPTTTEEPLTTLGSSPTAVIDATFDTSDSSCQEVASSELESGMAAAETCSLTTDENGNDLPSEIFVRYAKWRSLSVMNEFFDQDKQQPGYNESTWHFDATSSISRGRLIQFKYDDGQQGLDWTYRSKLVSGEAKTSGTQEQLKSWWRGATTR